jgi:two-component system, NtrC family, sensor histidine kinase HydH
LLFKIFMKNYRVNIKSLVSIPPWVIIAAVLILLPIFIFMTLENINRQKENTTRLLVEKGAALIRSFEAGARTGMMGMRWGGVQVQRLLTETAQQPDIVYLLITDGTGNILAHSDKTRIGKTYGKELDLKGISPSQNVGWRQIPNRKGPRIFEVFSQFSPTRGNAPGHRGSIISNDWCKVHMHPYKRNGDSGQIIFVGLDMEPVETARKDDARHTVVMGLILLLIGFAGFVSILLAQAYRTTRTSLSRVRAFSDSLVENMPIGLLAIDSDGRIASFNETAESILGLLSPDILWEKHTAVLPQPFLELVAQMKSGNGFIEKEIECPVTKGGSVPLEVIATFFKEEKGAFLGYVILFRDLSEVKQLKDEIARSERMASIGRLAAGVAHEIRNPLSSIKGFATYFKERYREVPEDQKTAEIMIQEVERLNKVVGQLLEFARPLNIEKKPTSLGALVQHSLKMIEADANGRGIKTNTSIPPDMEKAFVDPDKMEQVFLNLYLNAFEAMENGGTLFVELREDDSVGAVRIIISDNGTGIKDEDLTRVFDPYFTTKSSGTGLGLAIVHKIIESHGGEVRMESRHGEGTAVTILLPYSIEA